MNFFESHFWYTKNQRNGILLLLTFLIGFQVLLYHIELFFPQDDSTFNQEQLENWRAKLDSLSKTKSLENKVKVYRFNPNYLTDFKAYLLGMNPEEIDRLLEHRSNGHFVNSAEEFQSITKISDSLLLKISPLFRFPMHSKFKKNAAPDRTTYSQKTKGFSQRNKVFTKKDTKKDLNLASEEELQKVYGIGEKLSARIVSYRNLLKGFSVNEQLFEVYYLPKETADRILDHFEVKAKPGIVKLNVNDASFKELLRIPYLDYALTKKIVDLRKDQGVIVNLDELKKIDSFPLNKYERIALYLLAE